MADDAPHPVLPRYYEDEQARQAAVDALFDQSADWYEWVIGVMSFGSGRWYRRDALRRLGVTEGHSVLDVGAGTGTVTCVAQDLVGESGLVVAVDPSVGMLGEGVKRGMRAPVMGVASKLPVADSRFDALTMGYALRHVGSLGETFREYHRVLKPGGQLLLLEITPPKTKVGLVLLRFYLRHIVPIIAGLASRRGIVRKLMEYYWDTIEACVPPESVLAELEGVGFKEVHRHVVMGIFSEYRATRGETGS